MQLVNLPESTPSMPSPPEVVGPYRKTFSEALQELQELRDLQRRKGDRVAREEMLRRDVEAMTAFFVQSISWWRWKMCLEPGGTNEKWDLHGI